MTYEHSTRTRIATGQMHRRQVLVQLRRSSNKAKFDSNLILDILLLILQVNSCLPPRQLHMYDEFFLTGAMHELIRNKP